MKLFSIPVAARWLFCAWLAFLALQPLYSQDNAPAPSSPGDTTSPSTGNVSSPADNGGTGTPEIVPAPAPPPPGADVSSNAGITTPQQNLSNALSPSVLAPVPQQQPAASLSVPGGYNFLPQTVTPGQGRFAQPPYRITVSISQGYDDNVLTGPDHPARFHTSVIPTASNSTLTARLPQPSAVLSASQPKIGSWESTASLGLQIQLASPRTAFTVNATLGGVLYWHRPGGNADVNGSLTALYAHQVSSRLQFDAQANAVYQTTPDFGRTNSPTSQAGTVSYLSTSLHADASYKWLPRFQTVTSYNFDALVYASGSQTANNYYTNTFGNQFRFLVSPRGTAVAEYRIDYVSTGVSSSQTTDNFLLLGGDYNFSRRLNGTFRGGVDIRPYATSPYFETTVQYVYGHNSTLAWTNRYGFEPSGANGTRQTSYRTGLNVNQVLTGRITLSLGLNYNNFDTTSAGAAGSTSENDINTSLGANYVVNRSFSLNGSYTFTDVLFSTPNQSYTRNRVFLGGTYAF